MPFIGVTRELVSNLFREATEYNLREGEALFRACDAGDGCYRIQTGLVKIVVASHLGRSALSRCWAPAPLLANFP